MLLVFLLITLAGCNQDTHGNNKTEATDTTETKEIGFYTTDEDCFSIETRYGALEYPEKWKEITKTEIIEAEPYSVKFFCVTSEGDIPLFDMNFGSGEGFLLGTLPKDVSVAS